MVLLYLLACFWGASEPEELPGAPAEDPDNPLPTLKLGKNRPSARRQAPSNTTNPNAPIPAVTKEMCDDLGDGGDVAGPDCITAEIECGDVIVGHTRGGVTHFDTPFYEKKFCTPALTDHNGGDERVYRLRMPDGKWHADVWLDTPCADLDLAAMEVDDGDTCPGMESNVPRCEMWPKPKGKPEHVRLVTQRATTWLIVVEGKDDHEGAFAIHVECAEGF